MIFVEIARDYSSRVSPNTKSPFCSESSAFTARKNIDCIRRFVGNDQIDLTVPIKILGEERLCCIPQLIISGRREINTVGVQNRNTLSKAITCDEVGKPISIGIA